MKKRSAPKPVTAGKRVGTKRRDMRWQAPDGVVWASRFEYQVFLDFQKAGLNVRKCEEQDGLSYSHRVANGVCAACGSRDVSEEHRYTPDLFVGTAAGHGQQRGYFVEAKGYLRAERRSLLRSLRKAHPGLDLRLAVQRDYAVTKTMTILQWAAKYLKCKAVVWTGEIPKDWR